MKKFSELVKKSSIALNDYVPIIDSAATADVDKNKTTLFSTILNYFKQDMIANSQTVNEPGLKALDAVQANPNVSGTIADMAATLNGLVKASGLSPLRISDLNTTHISMANGRTLHFLYPSGTSNAPEAYSGIGITYRVSADYVAQVVLTDTSLWYRALRGGTWQVWRAVALNGKLLGGASAIPTGSNLNTYIKPGEYYVGTNTIAATIANIPLAVAGRLTVEYGVSYVDSTIYIRQTYTPHSSYIFNQFTLVRASTDKGNTWSAWQMVGAQIYSSKNTESVSVPSGAWTEMYRESNVPPGIYEITFSSLFGSASAGIRGIQFANVAVGGTPSWGTPRRSQTQMPVTSGNTAMTLTRVLRTTAVQDISFAILHTAGANINCSTSIDMLRLA